MAAALPAAPSSTSSAPASVPFRLAPNGSGIDIGSWSIACHSGTISHSAAIDAFFDETQIKAPEMVYLDNHITFTHTPTGASLSFNARDALKGCRLPSPSSPSPSASPSSSQSVPASIQVTHAKLWTGKYHDVDVQTLNLHYDWTYTTRYAGTVCPPPPPHSLSSSPHASPIPMALLSRADPILFYAALPLYEDELHDNGVASVSLKLRVMERCWFALQTFWLRVDDVCVKVYETRAYCEDVHGDDVRVVREFTAREETFESLIKRGMPRAPSSYTDPTLLARKLPLLTQDRDLIHIRAGTAP